MNQITLFIPQDSGRLETKETLEAAIQMLLDSLNDDLAEFGALDDDERPEVEMKACLCENFLDQLSLISTKE